MDQKRTVLETILSHPQTIQTLHKALQIPIHDLQSTLNDLENEHLIKSYECDLAKENASEASNYISFVCIAPNAPVCDSKEAENSGVQMDKTHENDMHQTPQTVKSKTKRKPKCFTAQTKKFKPPRFAKDTRQARHPQTTGSMRNKTESKLIGMKRKPTELQATNSDRQPSVKRFKTADDCGSLTQSNETKHTDPERRKMEKLQYEEQFLLNEIQQLHKTNQTNTTDKKDENCLSVEELTALTEKWTAATQQIIETIIKEKNDPNVTVDKLLRYFKIDPRKLRWNEEDQEFE